MLQRLITLAAVVLLAFGTVFSVAQPVSAQPVAQDSSWSMILLNGVSNQLIRVYLDGRQEQIDLGLPAGTYLGGNSVDFTNGGSRVAYCLVGNQADSAAATLTVKDVSGGAAPVTVDLGKTDGCWVTFSEDGGQVAVGLVRHYAGDPSADSSVPAWQLLIYDATNGQQVAEMNPTKAASASLDATRTIMPEVRYFTGGQVIFTGIQWGTEGFPSSPAYFWQLNSDSLQPIDRWWRWGLDSLPVTGELAWVELDQSLPAAEPGGPVPQGNVVKLADKTGTERMIYTSSDWVILDTEFIDNGRELAINELQAFDPSGSMTSQTSRWIALDRNGGTSELASSEGYSALAPAPDGYVYLWASDSSASPLLTLEYRSGRETVQLWQQQAQNGISWSILWTAPTPTADGLNAFPSVNP